MARLVSGRNKERQTRTIFRWPEVYRPRTCSYCGRLFVSLYAWGGHMTAHRRLIIKMREDYQAALMIQEPTVSIVAHREAPRTRDFLGLGKLIEGGGPVAAAAAMEDLEDGLDLSLKL